MKKTNLISLLIIIFLSINASADEKLYTIELIIFTQDMPNSEIFDQVESKIVWPERVAEISDYPAAKAKNISLLSSYKKIARSSQYQPLMHIAWTQSVKSNRFSKAVRITNSEGTIDGYFRMQRGHYVHMSADIEYSPGDYEESIIYRLNEKRRFKLNETHYLDHPKFGILARISPITQ